MFFLLDSLTTAKPAVIEFLRRSIADIDVTPAQKDKLQKVLTLSSLSATTAA